jgi:predicted DNA-binding transcriptional regulator AlpA
MTHVERDPLLTERELSTWLGISEPTLFRHRRDGTGPSFIRLSTRRVAYRRSAVEEWLRTREQRCISLPGEERHGGNPNEQKYAG